jgi:hypothetical protein
MGGRGGEESERPRAAEPVTRRTAERGGGRREGKRVGWRLGRERIVVGAGWEFAAGLTRGWRGRSILWRLVLLVVEIYIRRDKRQNRLYLDGTKVGYHEDISRYNIYLSRDSICLDIIFIYLDIVFI